MAKNRAPNSAKVLAAKSPNGGAVTERYSSRTVRKIDNGFIESCYDSERGSSERYHASDPDLAASKTAGQSSDSGNLRGAVEYLGEK